MTTTSIVYRINDEPAQTWTSNELPPLLGVVDREARDSAMFIDLVIPIIEGERGLEDLMIEGWLSTDDQDGPPRWRHGHKS